MTSKALFVLLLATMSIGCGQGPQTQEQKDRAAEDYAKSFGVDARVTTQPDGTKSVVVNRNIGATNVQGGSNVPVPANFPKDIPAYPQLQVFAVGELPNGGHMLQGQSADGPDRVAEFYNTQMKSSGWTERPSQGPMPGMRMMQFQKGGRTASINLIGAPSGTTVQIMTPAGG